MAALSLAAPHDLYDTRAERGAFEETRRPAFLVHVAEVVENSFVLRDADWDGLFSYIVQHWEMGPVLLEAPEAIRKIFGEVRLTLDLVKDPEEGWEQLFIVVMGREPVAQAVERLRRLDQSWFADAARLARFAINVTIEPDV